MSTHSMDYSMEEEIIEIPLTDDIKRSSGRSLKRNSSQSLDGSMHSTGSAYTFEEVDSVHSDYTFETLEGSLQNSFSSVGDIASPAPPTNVSVPSDSMDNMKSFLRGELGLDVPTKEAPKKEDRKEPPKKISPLDEMKSYLRSELGIDMTSPKASKPQNSTGAASFDLPTSSFSMDNKKSKEFATFGDSELARSIAFLKEGVDVEEIEYIMSDEEEIIDDVFDHMGGLDGRDTVMLESYGLEAIPEVSHSEYDSEIDDSIRLPRTSEVSMLSSTDFDLPIGDINHDEVDTEPDKPKPTGLHETVKKSEEKVGIDSMDVDEPIKVETQPQSPKSSKAAKWKDRVKKKRRKSSDKAHEHDEMKIDNSLADKEGSQKVQQTDKIHSKGKSRESKAESSSNKGKDSDGSPAPPKNTESADSNSKTKAKKGKEESHSHSDSKESKSSSKSKHKKKGDKWRDRLEKKRSKKDLSKQESDDDSTPSTPTDAENDLKDSSHLPIHVANAKSEHVQDEPDTSHDDLPVGDVVMKVDGLDKAAANSTEAEDTVQGDKARSPKKEDSPKDKTLSRSHGVGVRDQTDTIGERKGDEDNDQEDTTHSMRVFDDEFGSVSGFSEHLQRSSVSFDLSLSNSYDFGSEQANTDQDNNGVVYEVELKLKDDPDNSSRRSRRDDSIRSLRGVFDDELGDLTSGVRSSFDSQQNSVLEELDSRDRDDETVSSNDEGEWLLSKAASTESNESGTSNGNNTGMKSSRENKGESKNNFKFELPNELLEAIHCHHNKKNINEKQGDREPSDVLPTQNGTPTEKEKDGSATYSTLPPTIEESSRTFGDEVAENTETGVSTPDLIDEVSQDGSHSDEETAETIDTAQKDMKVQKKESKRPKGSRVSGESVETERLNDSTQSDEKDSTSVETKHASLAPSQSNTRGSGGKTSSKVSGSKKSKTDGRNAADSNNVTKSASKHKKRSKRSDLNRSQSEGNLLKSTEEKKSQQHSSQNDTHHKSKSRKRSKTRSKKAPSRSRSLEGMELMGASSEGKDSSDDKDGESSPNRTQGVRRSLSMGPMEDLRTKKRKEKRSGVDDDPTVRSSSDDGKETRGDLSGGSEKPALPSSDKDQLPETADSASPREIEHKKQLSGGNEEGRDALLLSPGTRRSRKSTSIDKPANNVTKSASKSKKRDKHKKAKSRKRSKTRSKKGPSRSRSVESSDSKDTSDDSVGLSDDGTETRGDLSGSSEKPAPPPSGKDQLQETADSASSREIGHKKQLSGGNEEGRDVPLLSPGTIRRRKSSLSPKVDKSTLRRRKSSDGKSPRNRRKPIDRPRKCKSVDLLHSPGLGKKSVDLSEDVKLEMKSPKKGGSNAKDIKSPKAEKPSLRRRKSDNGKSPRTPSRKSLDKIRSPARKKKSLSAIPDLESDSPRKSPSSRRSLDVLSPTQAKKNSTSKRRNSENSMENNPTINDKSEFATKDIWGLVMQANGLMKEQS